MIAIGFLFLALIIGFSIVCNPNYHFRLGFFKGRNLILLRYVFYLKLCNLPLKFKIFFFKLKHVIFEFWIRCLEFRREVRRAFHCWALDY